MKRLLLLLLVFLPIQTQAARLFVAANSDKIAPSEGCIQGGSWALSIWFKLTTVPSAAAQYTLFHDGGTGGSRYNPAVLYENVTNKRFRVFTSSNIGVFNQSTYNVDLNAGQWYHLALMSGDRGGSNVFKIYLDGTERTWTTGGGYSNEANHGGGAIA